jgi:hypothetical protein
MLRLGWQTLCLSTPHPAWLVQHPSMQLLDWPVPYLWMLRPLLLVDCPSVQHLASPVEAFLSMLLQVWPVAYLSMLRQPLLVVYLEVFLLMPPLAWRVVCLLMLHPAWPEDYQEVYPSMLPLVWPVDCHSTPRQAWLEDFLLVLHLAWPVDCQAVCRLMPPQVWPEAFLLTLRLVWPAPFLSMLSRAWPVSSPLLFSSWAPSWPSWTVVPTQVMRAPWRDFCRLSLPSSTVCSILLTSSPMPVAWPTTFQLRVLAELQEVFLVQGASLLLVFLELEVFLVQVASPLLVSLVLEDSLAVSHHQLPRVYLPDYPLILSVVWFLQVFQLIFLSQGCPQMPSVALYQPPFLQPLSMRWTVLQVAHLSQEPSLRPLPQACLQVCPLILLVVWFLPVFRLISRLRVFPQMLLEALSRLVFPQQLSTSSTASQEDQNSQELSLLQQRLVYQQAYLSILLVASYPQVSQLEFPQKVFRQTPLVALSRRISHQTSLKPLPMLSPQEVFLEVFPTPPLLWEAFRSTLLQPWADCQWILRLPSADYQWIPHLPLADCLLILHLH